MAGSFARSDSSLRARSTWGTEFVIYDDGVNPKEAENAKGKKVRQEYGVVIYETNVLGSRGPRKMKVCLPQVNDEDGSRVSEDGAAGSGAPLAAP